MYSPFYKSDTFKKVNPSPRITISLASITLYQICFIMDIHAKECKVQHAQKVGLISCF